jgi:integrase
VAWEAACRPAKRLRAGGRAAHLAPITRRDLERRYGYFLDFLARTGRLDRDAPVAHQVTPENVRGYVEELQGRVSSVTLYGSIYKLRRVAQIISPGLEVGWLKELEADLDLLKIPHPKHDRIVLSEELVTAGLTLIEEAEMEDRGTALTRATAVRNGLMIALLALCPIRLASFAGLRLGTSFVRIRDRWWIKLEGRETKSGRPDERPVPGLLDPWLDRWLACWRTVFREPSDALWPSRYGGPLSYSGVERIVTETTRSSLGVAISPHLFRHAAASTLAVYAGAEPGVAAALLQHVDPRVTEEHYNRASSTYAAQGYLALINKIEGEAMS